MILHYCRTSSNYIFFYFYCFDGATPGGRKLILCVDMDKNSYLSIYRLNGDAPYICQDFLFNFWKKNENVHHWRLCYCHTYTLCLTTVIQIFYEVGLNATWRPCWCSRLAPLNAPWSTAEYVKQTEYLNLKNRGTPDFSVGRERDFQRVIYLFPVSSLRFICINTNTHITYAVLC